MFRNRGSWLDQIVETFQHRWETNPQYRAAVSGVVAVALLIAMCACTGVVSAATGAALAGLGLGGSTRADASNINTGTHRVTGAKTFPTPTVVLAPGDLPAISQLPDSQTPQPRPTAIPTPTPGPGDGGSSSCHGSQNNATGVFSPCPLVHGEAGTFSIYDSNRRHAGAAISGTITFCAGDPACTLTIPSDGSYRLDLNGRATISFTVPSQATDGTPVTASITISPIASSPSSLTVVASPAQ